MVLQAERFNGGYQQQSFSAYQGPTGGYNSYQSVTDYTSPPYSGSGPFQGPTFPSSHGQHHQSGNWSSGGADYYGNGGSHLVKPSTGGYGNSYYGNSYNQGHDSGHGYGHGHQLTHGPNSYGTGGPGYGPNYGGSNNFGHQQPSWIVKGVDDE